jgi:hypothetical protein
VEPLVAVTERKDRSGETVEMVTPADRTDLTGCEEAGHSAGAEPGADSQNVVIG